MSEVTKAKMDEIKNKDCYVTMRDQVMSNWGKAEGKKHIFVVGCDNVEEASVIAKAAETRQEMKNVRIRFFIPRHYMRDRYYLYYRDYGELHGMWKVEE